MVKFHKENRIVSRIQEGGEWYMVELLFNGDRVPVLQNQDFWRLVAPHCKHTVSYRTVYLKMIKMENFMLSILPQLKNFLNADN